MALPANLTEKVAEAMRQAAQEIILPRFQHLASGEVEEKSPGEMVTVADRESEQFISARLRDLLPGSFVVGEELAELQPEVIDRVGSGKIWLVDPLDGTANFVAGKPLFSVMVSLVIDGEAVLGLMLNPVTGVLHHAEQGGGAWRDAVRLKTTPGTVPVSQLRGALLNRLMTPELRAGMIERGKLLRECLPGLGCAGIEYPAIAEGQEDFAIFWRSLPWDHVPGALFLREAGGVSRRLDGRDYQPADRSRGLIVARSPEVYETICEEVIGRAAW